MALPQDHIRAMDQLRSRLAHLSNSIGELKYQLESNDPLPAWPALQAASTTLSTNLGEVATVLNTQRQLFTSLHPYPQSNFPGHAQEGLLQQLLRKKLEPRAQEWIDDALHADHQDDPAANGAPPDAASDALAEQDIRALWDWAGSTTRQLIEEMQADGALQDVFSIQERRDGIMNVVTGLQMDLHGSGEGAAGERDGGEMAIKMEADQHHPQADTPPPNGLDPTKPPMSLENLLRFQSGA